MMSSRGIGFYIMDLKSKKKCYVKSICRTRIDDVTFITEEFETFEIEIQLLV